MDKIGAALGKAAEPLKRMADHANVASQKAREFNEVWGRLPDDVKSAIAAGQVRSVFRNMFSFWR